MLADDTLTSSSRNGWRAKLRLIGALEDDRTPTLDDLKRSWVEVEAVGIKAR
jgi:hypothetical protein